MRSGIVGFGLVVAATIVLAGCSSATTGGATSTSTAGTTTTTAAGSGAPKVTTPVDISKYQQTPCSGLTTSQLTSLGIKDKTGQPGTMNGSNGALGVNCVWLTPSAVSVVIGYTTTNKDGLAYFYSNGGTLQRLSDIDGQPAVKVPVSGSNGTCDIAVGASDTTFYDATVVGMSTSDPCTLAQQVATAMTQTIKSGS